MSQEMVVGMRDLSLFLNKLREVFGALVKNMDGFEKQVNEYNKSFTTLSILKFS